MFLLGHIHDRHYTERETHAPVHRCEMFGGPGGRAGGGRLWETVHL